MLQKSQKNNSRTLCFTEYNLTVHLHVERQSSSIKTKCPCGKISISRASENIRDVTALPAISTVFSRSAETSVLCKPSATCTRKNTQNAAPLHTALDYQRAPVKGLGAGGRYVNALTDANRARLNADWKCLRVEVLVRFLSAENREGGSQWGVTLLSATNVLIAISECDCKQGCNLWLGTVSVSDSVSGLGVTSEKLPVMKGSGTTM